MVFRRKKHYVTGNNISREITRMENDSADGPITLREKKKSLLLPQVIPKTTIALCTEESQYKFDPWGLTIATTTTKLSVQDKMCFPSENIISGMACIIDEVAKLCGYGTQLDLVKISPYKVLEGENFGKNSKFRFFASSKWSTIQFFK